MKWKTWKPKWDFRDRGAEVTRTGRSPEEALPPALAGLATRSYVSHSVPEALGAARQQLGEEAMLVNTRPARAGDGTRGRYEVVFAVSPAQKPRAASVPAALAAAGITDPLAAKLAEFRDAGALRAELAAAFTCDCGIVWRGPARVAFAGPPGAGKTTLLLRVAVQAKRRTSRKVRIVTFDTRRIGRVEALRRHGALLGIDVSPVLTGRDAEKALGTESAGALTLIDTPGFAPDEDDKLTRLSGWLRRGPEVEVHLVLSALTNAADRRRLRERYSRFSPGRLAFTHLDETSAWGGVVSEAHAFGVPVSFLGAGQRLCDGPGEASQEQLCDHVASQLDDALLAPAVAEAGPEPRGGLREQSR